MNIVLAITVGVLYATGLNLMMRRSLIELIIGLAVLSHAAHLLIFTAGGLVRAGVPIIEKQPEAASGEIADPLPQALILTAIVISFAVTAFAVVLIYRAFQTVGTDDLNELRSTDRPDMDSYHQQEKARAARDSGTTVSEKPDKDKYY